MELKFNNQKFNIMVIGDVHEKYEGGKETDDFLRMLNKMADTLNPDLAVYMGDLVSQDVFDENGNRSPATKEQILTQIKRITDPLTSRNIPFAIVFGNHDGEGEDVFPKETLLELFREIPGFVVDDTVVTTEDIFGCGNGNILIKSSDGTKNVFNLWLIDSGNLDPEGGYARVQQDQIDWYERTAAKLKDENGGVPLPAAVFQHIPIPEEYELLKETSKLNPLNTKGFGVMSDKYYLLDPEKATGYLGEGPAAPNVNSGEFESWKRTGDVVCAFFGHDHMNEFTGELDGIVLRQCRGSGFHIYGDGLKQGVCMLRLNENDPRNFQITTHHYRDYFGTKSDTIKGYMLLSDRWHTNFKKTLTGLGIATGVTAAALGVKTLVKKLGRK